MYRHREDFEHLEHRLENNTKSPYPSFYQGLPWVEPEQQQQRQSFPPEEQQQQNNNNNRGRVPREYFDDNCALWIGNLDPRVSDTILFELFCQAGTIKNITFPGKNQENDLSTRFCFVNFMMPDSVPRAMDMMQGTVLFGRKLFLKYRPNSIHALPTMMNKYQQSIYHHHQNQKWNRVNNNNNQNVMASHEVSRSLPSVVNCNGKHAPKDQRERSHSVSSDQGQTFPSENDEHSSIKKYSPVRAPSPNANIVDSNDTGDGCSSPYKSESNHHNMKLSRRPPYYYNAAHCRSANTPTRKVMIKSSSGTSIPDTNIPHHRQRERTSTSECDGEYDPTDPEIR